MRRAFAAAVMLAVIFLLSVLLTFSATRKADLLIAVTEQVYKDNKSEHELSQAWEENSRTIILLVERNHTDPISAMIYELKYMSDEDKKENCARIISELNEIKEHISLSLYTVF